MARKGMVVMVSLLACLLLAACSGRNRGEEPVTLPFHVTPANQPLAQPLLDLWSEKVFLLSEERLGLEVLPLGAPLDNLKSLRQEGQGQLLALGAVELVNLFYKGQDRESALCRLLYPPSPEQGENPVAQRLMEDGWRVMGLAQGPAWAVASPRAGAPPLPQGGRLVVGPHGPLVKLLVWAGWAANSSQGAALDLPLSRQAADGALATAVELTADLAQQASHLYPAHAPSLPQVILASVELDEELAGVDRRLLRDTLLAVQKTEAQRQRHHFMDMQAKWREWGGKVHPEKVDMGLQKACGR